MCAAFFTPSKKSSPKLLPLSCGALRPTALTLQYSTDSAYVLGMTLGVTYSLPPPVDVALGTINAAGFIREREPEMVPRVTIADVEYIRLDDHLQRTVVSALGKTIRESGARSVPIETRFQNEISSNAKKVGRYLMNTDALQNANS